MRLDEEKRPEVLGKGSVVCSVLLHLALFLFFFVYGKLNFRPKEQVIPIDLTLVVNENLDGVDNEPPPLADPPPDPPKPVDPPKPPVDPPKPPDPPNPPPDSVIKVPPKDPPKDKPKPSIRDRIRRIDDKKPPDPPKDKPKTRDEKLRDRIKRTNVKVNIKVDNQPSGNGRTDKKLLSDAEIRKLLGQGYKAGTKTQLATSEEQRCLSLIYQAYYSHWKTPAWSPMLRNMHLKISLGANGRITGYSLVQQSGDRAADHTVILAAQQVTQVYGLTPEFISKHRNDLVIVFEVKP